MNRYVAWLVLLCMCLSSLMTVNASVHAVNVTSAVESNHDCHHDKMTMATDVDDLESHKCCEQDSRHTCSGNCCDCDSSSSALINCVALSSPLSPDVRVDYSISATSPPTAKQIIPPIT